jgi:hypothetical protein
VGAAGRLVNTALLTHTLLATAYALDFRHGTACERGGHATADRCSGSPAGQSLSLSP